MTQLKSGTARRGIGADLRGNSNKKRARNRLIRAAGLAVATLGTSAGGLFVMTNAFGATITLVTTDTAGQESFDANATNTSGITHWSDGNVPSAANDYIVDGGSGSTLGAGAQLRSPNVPLYTNGTNETFAGNSLTLGGGSDSDWGIFTYKGNELSGDTITINNLTLNAGVLQCGGTSGGTANTWILASNNLVVGSGGFYVDNGAVAARGETIAANITGAGALTDILTNGGNSGTDSINGGTLTFTGNNSLWSGTELIKGGVLQVGSGGTAGSLGTGNVTVDNTLQFDLTSNVSYSQTFTVDASQTGTISNMSTGTVTLSGVTVNGTLALSNTTGALNFTGPIATGSTTGTLAITNGGGAIAIGGVTGSAAVSVSGTGTTSISGAGTYSGNTTVNGGTLAFIGGAPVPTSTVWTVAPNAVLDLSAATGTLTTTSAGTITGGGTIKGNVSSGGNLSPGTGTSTIGTLSINGNLSLTGGTFDTTLNTTSVVPGGTTNDLIAVTGNLAITGSVGLDPSFTAGTPTVGSQYELISYTGSLSGAGALVPQNRSISISTATPGEVIATITTATAANLIWKSTSSGTWDIVTTPNWFNTGTSSNDTFYQADNVTFNDTYAGVQTNVNLSTALSPTTVTVNSNANTYTLGGTGKITGGAVVNVTLGASNSLVITANNDYSGTTTINSGTVNIGNGGTTGSLGSGTVVNNGTLLYTRSDTPTVATVINGTGSLVINGGGVSLTGANGYTGGTNIEAGAVYPHNNTALGAATSTVQVQSGALLYSIVADTFPEPIDLFGGTTANMEGGGATTSTYSGPVTIDPSAGAAVISVDGGATLALTDPTAALTSSAGPILKVTGSGVLAFGGNVNLGAGGYIEAATTIAFVPAASTTITMNTQITDGATAGSINQNGAGTTVLAVDNSYSGATTVTNGVLEPQSANAIPFGAPTTNTITIVGNASTGYLGLTGVGETTIQNTITLDGRPAATYPDIDNITGNNTIAGNMTGVVGGNNYILQSDAGLLTVTGNFACGGSTTGARIFDLQGAGNGNFTGLISDGTSTGTPLPFVMLDVNGPGTWSLSGANSYSGGTTVNGGTLTVATGGTLGATTGPLAVNNPNTGAGTNVVLNLSTSAATTTGSLSGTIAVPSSGVNTATINNGGQLFTVNQTTAGAYAGTIAGTGGFTLGSLSTSTLTLSGTDTYSGGTTVNAGTLLIDPTSTPASTSALPKGSVSITSGLLQLAPGVSGGTGPTPTSSVKITSLSITGSSQFDLNNNHIIITYGSSDPFSTIAGYIKSGYNAAAGGTWNGPGIISSAALIKTNGLSYGVGYADGKDGKVSGLVSGQIEVAYTLLGDANLDGIVNATDFTILAANFNQPVTGWDQGDFNYDG
ncbi:MAG: autotransporter-associated beta strand repeat-containing protein, partial [Tepidisphaeraceae bacterium]